MLFGNASHGWEPQDSVVTIVGIDFPIFITVNNSEVIARQGL